MRIKNTIVKIFYNGRIRLDSNTEISIIILPTAPHPVINVFGHWKRFEKLSWQDSTWAGFSTLDVAVLVYAMQLSLQQKQPNLKLKTQPKLLLGYPPLVFVLTALRYERRN